MGDCEESGHELEEVAAEFSSQLLGCTVLRLESACPPALLLATKVGVTGVGVETLFPMALSAL